jgi:hypothetical protein
MYPSPSSGGSLDTVTEWRPIPGWEGLYEVSDDAQIRSLCYRSEPYIMKQQVGNRGYLRVNLGRDGRDYGLTVHRLVAMAFVPNPNGHKVVRHLNDIQTDNRPANLAWGTFRQNSLDILRNGNHASQRQTMCMKGLHERTPENLVQRRKPDGRTVMTCKPCELHRSREGARRRAAAKRNAS